MGPSIHTKLRSVFPHAEVASHVALEDLELSIRGHNGLKRLGVAAVGDILELTVGRLREEDNVGVRTVSEIMDRLHAIDERCKPERTTPLFSDEELRFWARVAVVRSSTSQRLGDIVDHADELTMALRARREV